MGPGSQILVRSGFTLSIGLSILQGCNTMWQGIVLEDGAILSVIANDIRDAQIAINCQGNADIGNCYSNVFMNNHIGIRGNGGYISTPLFAGNTFNFTGFLPFFAGQTPTPGIRTFAGIELDQSSMYLTSGANNFINLQNGISGERFENYSE